MDKIMKALAEVVGMGLAEEWLREQAQKPKVTSATQRQEQQISYSKSSKESHRKIQSRGVATRPGVLPVLPLVDHLPDGP